MGKKKDQQPENEANQPVDELPKLTLKQRRFVEEYTKDWNATGAAIRAGYSEASAAIIGHENLRKLNIKKAVDERVETLCMSANEALIRMSDFARGNFTHFLEINDDNRVTLDLSSHIAQQNFHLIKKVKQTERTYMEDKQPVKEVYTEIEIHDAKDAVAKVLQMHGKLIDRKTIDHTSGGLPVESTTIVFGKGVNNGEADSPK